MRDLKLGDEIPAHLPAADRHLFWLYPGWRRLHWPGEATPPTRTPSKSLEYITQPSFRAYFGLYSNLQPAARLCFIDFKTNFDAITDYSFVLDTPRNQTQFIQEYKVPLQALGINLTFLPNNGPAYWAAVDPIRRSSSADILVFGMLMVVALSMAVFIYLMQHRRDYAILRALGVPAKPG